MIIPTLTLKIKRREAVKKERKKKLGTIIGIEENQNEKVCGITVKFVSCDIAITYAASAQSLCLLD